jgi:hypothetical protein
MPARRPHEPELPPTDMRRRLVLPDALLLAECEVHTYRASGPGGQKRNKTSSAVRLHHRPSGLITTGTESRSQHENKARALRRLREALAITFRMPLPTVVRWAEPNHVAGGTLHVNSSHQAVYGVLAMVLDALADCRGVLTETAAKLGVSGSSIVRFLAEHPHAWAEANRIRAAASLPPLK